MSTPLHSVSVAGAIFDDEGKILAIRRRDNGHWEPPGGVLELDETIEDGLIREVQEETGLQIEPDKLTGVYKNMKLGIVALVFRCRRIAGALKATTEAVEFAWLDESEIRARMDEAYAVRMLDAQCCGSPAVRAHDGKMIY